MAQDQNKKTLRSFQSRDYLWEIFEQMSGELECSVDYLINEAMRQYARSRSYQVGGTLPGLSRAPGPMTGAPPAPAPDTAPPPPHRSVPPTMPSRPSSMPPPPPRQSTPPSMPPASPFGVQRPPLFLVFNGQKIPISSEEFVIGRSSKSADLAIKDGNISRRHAAVLYEEGAYVIRDLGSTNGIEYGGQRIAEKGIEEGDVFHICDYELKFTYY